MKYATTAILLPALALALPADLESRQSGCPNIHVFGARETTASPGYGSAGTVVNLILGAYSGSTAEAISYPACGGGSSCGGVSYSASVAQGTTAVGNAVNAFNAKCPNTKLVYVGYSQGAEIGDNALCGGGDAPQGLTNTAMTINAAARAQIKAVIWMGDPRHAPNQPFNKGTSNAGGFSARPSGFSCPPYSSIIQSYCDAADPYCSNGNNAATHNGYAQEYGQAALTFVKSKLG